MTLKNSQCPPKHYISILMMYLCKFGHNISTRCSDEMQIRFFLPWVGYFGIVLVGEKVTPYELARIAIFQTYTVLFGISKRFIVNNNSVVI